MPCKTQACNFGIRSKTSMKSQKVLGILRRNLWSCGTEEKKSAFNSLVRPLLDYSSCAWDPHLLSDTHCLERVQRHAARFICKEYRTTKGTTTALLKHLEWVPLEKQWKTNRLTMMYKIVNGWADISADAYLTPNTRSTRGNHKKFQKIRARTRAFENSFFLGQ